MWFSSRLRNGKRGSRSEHRRARAIFKPRLEALEDRCVPSTLTVTNTSDDVNVKGSLRYDVAHAASGDTILITGALHGAPIDLTNGELLLTQDVTIKSVPNHPQTISGGGVSRVFEVAANAHVTLKGLDITDGNGVADNPNGTSSIDGEGGGVLNFGTLTASGCTLSGNSATVAGGGICNSRGTVTLSGCTLSGNSGASAGGGIYSSNGGTVTLRCSSLSSNSATLGGGVFNSGGAATLSGCTLSHNSAAIDGGGIFTTFGTLTVGRCVLSDNSAGSVHFGGTGGGIVNIDGTATVSDSFLSGNSAANAGGIFMNSGVGVGSLTVRNSILSDNTARSFGGGIELIGGASATVRDSLVFGNTAGQDGGGIYIGGASVNLVVDHSHVFANTAQDGGGIFNSGGTVTVKNFSLIIGNTAPVGADVDNYGALYLDSTSTIGILDHNPAIPI